MHVFHEFLRVERTLHAMCSREHMAEHVARMVDRREFEDVKDVPPLDIILYRELMETAWSWDRLLVWESGYVLSENYWDYLSEFFQRNSPAILSLHASASRCLEMEEKLRNCAEGFTPDDYRLSGQIKEYARFMIESDLESPAVAAGLMCITEEADLMCELLACKAKNDVEEEDFIKEVLEGGNLKFSNSVRRVAFDILSTYKGPSSVCLAASMLGMQKEANIMHGLLNRKQMDCFDRLHVCESQRRCLRRFLYGIQTRLPQTAANIYPNDDPCTPITKMSPELLPSEQGKESVADEMSFSATDDGVAVPNTTKITITATLAAPIPCAATVVNVNQPDQEKDSSKTKSMGDTQGSEVTISQTSNPSIVSGNAAGKQDGCRFLKRHEGCVEYQLLRGVSPPYEQAEAPRLDGPNAGGEEKHMLKKTSVIKEGSIRHW